MKKQKIFLLGLVLLVCFISIQTNGVKASNPFNSVMPGDQLSWEVTNYNETINTVDPADWWRPSDFAFMGEYNLTIGQLINFTVSETEDCSGTLNIGTLKLTSIGRHDIGFNLILFTGPVSPPYYNYSFDPAFISPTNWHQQIVIAFNASNERFGSLNITIGYMIIFGIYRSIISFEYNSMGQFCNASYDYETGLLLYSYAAYSNWWLELSLNRHILANTFEIDGFLISLVIIAVLTIIIIRKTFHSKSIGRFIPQI